MMTELVLINKSPPTAVGAPPAKKSRLSGLTGATVRDVSYAEASKLATVHEFNFFDRARKALRSQHVYDNFLRSVYYDMRTYLLCKNSRFRLREKWLLKITIEKYKTGISDEIFKKRVYSFLKGWQTHL